jgi:hypothetical protein
LTGGLNSINVGWDKNTSLAARQTAVISAFFRGGLLVTFPLYPASRSREIMLSTSRVLLKAFPVDPEPDWERARGLGEVDKEDEEGFPPGGTERDDWGETDIMAEGGGGEDDRNGLEDDDDEVGWGAVMVWVVGIWGW